MSYSFQVRAATKALALAAVAAQLDAVVNGQSVHAKDRAQAMAAAEAFVGVLEDNPDKDVDVSMHGSVSWSYVDGDENRICSVNCSVTASNVDRAA